MFNALFRPTIRDAADLRRYVLAVTACCAGVTLTVDVASQLIFFVDWSSAWRDWAITAVESIGLAAPISLGIGRTNLELFEAKQTAERASRTDPLTGLMNRRALAERVRKLDGATLALVIADIDHFKRVNDTFGHLTGDRVIEMVGHVLSEDLADFGPLARVGGEEFALVSGAADQDAIAARLEKSRRRISETPIIAGGSAVKVTVSAGVASGGKDQAFEKIYARADRALYLAKTSGRNRVLKFDDLDALTPLDRRGMADERPGGEKASA